MAEILLCSTKDLRSYSIVEADVDDDKLLHHMKEAHDTHLLNYLGTDLLAALKDGVDNADLTANETTLLNSYVKWMAIYWSLVELFTFLPYRATNKGVYKHTAEDSIELDKSEIDSLVQQYRDKAEFYTEEFIDYMYHNEDLFPEYTSNTNEDTSPDTNAYFGGWQLNSSNCTNKKI